jgi:hypothetical protein
MHGDFGGGHHAGGGHHHSGVHHAGDRNDGGQVIPLFGDEARPPGRWPRRPGRGARGFIADGIIILIAVIAVVAIAALIFP